jgi:hypothetical protein
VTDGNEIPLAMVLTGAIQHVETQVSELVDRTPSATGSNELSSSTLCVPIR